MKTRTSRIIRNQKCPYCKKERMSIKETYRVNYPFGHKTKPRLTLISKTKFCWKCGEIKR